MTSSMKHHSHIREDTLCQIRRFDRVCYCRMRVFKVAFAPNERKTEEGKKEEGKGKGMLSTT